MVENRYASFPPYVTDRFVVEACGCRSEFIRDLRQRRGNPAAGDPLGGSVADQSAPTRRLRLALGAAARWAWMRCSSTLAGSSSGSCGCRSEFIRDLRQRRGNPAAGDPLGGSVADQSAPTRRLRLALGAAA
ncbi:hypothetical protein V2S84_17135, partial [Azotobacter chroococcum]|nr:hypothetical protein [Azotobacter chroococcum]